MRLEGSYGQRNNIGAVAIPAVVTKNFEAVTFLALALEQFRNVRRMETDSLQVLDDVETVSRGEAYIDGIAKTLQAEVVHLQCGDYMIIGQYKIFCKITANNKQGYVS